jgi:hypothetical protein
VLWGCSAAAATAAMGAVGHKLGQMSLKVTQYCTTANNTPSATPDNTPCSKLWPQPQFGLCVPPS